MSETSKSGPLYPAAEAGPRKNGGTLRKGCVLLSTPKPHYTRNTFLKICTSNPNQKVLAGSGDTHLCSQYSGGRGRWSSEFEASLVYRVPGQPWLLRETLSPQTKKKINKKKVLAR